MKKTWRPTAAGILTIIAGCMGIGIGAYVNVFSEFISELAVLADLVDLAELGRFFTVFSGVAIGLGIVALIGGIFALKRKVWRLALAGAIVSLPMIPVGTTPGILSIIFLYKGKREFA